MPFTIVPLLRTYRFPSIFKLSGVLDTSLYEVSLEDAKSHKEVYEWLANQPGFAKSHKKAYEWLANQPRFDARSISASPYRTEALDCLVGILVDQLQRLDETEGCIPNDRRLAILEDTRLAVVPASTKRGDLVCFIPGCNSPLVVRDAKTEHERTQERCRPVHLIGACIVDFFISVSDLRTVRYSNLDLEYITID